MANSCVKTTPRAPWHSCVLMLHSFTTRELELGESWHCCPGICPSHQGGKKIHWWDNLVIPVHSGTLPTCCAWTWQTEATPDHNTTICWFKFKLLFFGTGSVYHGAEFCSAPVLSKIILSNIRWSSFYRIISISIQHHPMWDSIFSPHRARYL